MKKSNQFVTLPPAQGLYNPKMNMMRAELALVANIRG